MQPFYMYVSIGALALLILILTVIGVVMMQIQSSAPFPPTQNACPDYWDVSSNPNYCGVPLSGLKNIGDINKSGTGSNTKIDDRNAINIGMCTVTGFGCKSNPTLFDSTNSAGVAQIKNGYQYLKLNNNDEAWRTLYPGSSQRCAQKQWASTMSITWDGVTNYNSC